MSAKVDDNDPVDALLSPVGVVTEGVGQCKFYCRRGDVYRWSTFRLRKVKGKMKDDQDRLGESEE